MLTHRITSIIYLSLHLITSIIYLSLHLSLRICLPTFIITITFFIQNTNTTQAIHLPGGGQKASCLGALVGCLGGQGLGAEKRNLTVGLIH